MLESVGLVDLWLPILVSAVILFVASFLAHVVLPFHKKDFKGVPNEDAFLEHVRTSDIKPGAYFFPYCTSCKELSENPDLKKKFEAGPHGIMYRWAGMGSMGANLVLTFLFYILVGIFVGYITSLACAAGTDYVTVFRVAGATAVSAFVLGKLPHDVWFRRPLRNVLVDVIDGVVYALLMAGTFGWLWPDATVTAF